MGQGERLSVMAESDIREAFPKISQEGYRITSEETADYNCFAWALGDKSQWWSPTEEKGYVWRMDVPRDLTVKTFCELYKHEGGYVLADHADMEGGFEKIAIYADAAGNVTHVAKQTVSGQWTSKLGDWEDIEHNTLAALEGKFYGKTVQILKRSARRLNG